MRLIKKIKFNFILAVTLLVNINGLAQNLIAVKNANSDLFFTTLDSAIIEAHDGDTIYIPGGSFSLAGAIDKRVYIFGVGHNPDSTMATNITLIAGNIILNKNSSGGSLTGVRCSNIELNPGTDDTVSNYSISRCYFNYINYYGYYIGDHYSRVNNCIFSENVIQEKIYIQNSKSNLFSNNIISGGSITIGTDNIVRNNIFLRNETNGNGLLTTNSLIENNIFISTTYSTGNISNSIVNNNLFVENLNSSICTNCVGLNNYVGINPNSIFVNQSGYTFSYQQDYRLSNPLIYTGADGSPIGIYGGFEPWKEGSIPVNPHIQYKVISSTTNQQGNLPINIKVAAQNF